MAIVLVLLNGGNNGVRVYDLRLRNGRYDLRAQEWLGFGGRVLTEQQTGTTTVDFVDNVTYSSARVRPPARCAVAR